MTDYDRGPSSPEPPLAFDPRRPVRGAGPVPATLIISGVILVGLIGTVAFIYRGGVRHPSGPPANVGAPVGDYKAPPPAETPRADAGAGLSVYKTNAPAANVVAASPTLAPAPEQPQPRPGEIAPAAQASAGPPPPPPPPAAEAKAAAPSVIATLTDAAANKPAPAKTAAPSAKAAAAPPAGAGWVQIGAFSSPALADKGWTDVARLEPAAMAGKGKRVEPTDKDGETFYRTYITGFSSKAAAQAFCDRLKADERACIVK